MGMKKHTRAAYPPIMAYIVVPKHRRNREKLSGKSFCDFCSLPPVLYRLKKVHFREKIIVIPRIFPFKKVHRPHLANPNGFHGVHGGRRQKSWFNKQLIKCWFVQWLGKIQCAQAIVRDPHNWCIHQWYTRNSSQISSSPLRQSKYVSKFF